MNEFYVYELIDPRDGKPFYVGKGKKDRMYHHVKKVKKNDQNDLKKNPHKFYKIKQILDSGFDDIAYKLVLSEVNEGYAFDKEVELIKVYGKDSLTNMTDGGAGGKNDVAAKTNSILRKGRTWEEIYGAEQAKKMREELRIRSTGKNNPFFGKTHSEENKKLFAENSRRLHTGRKRSEETRKHLSEGISKSEKHKRWRETIKSDEYKKTYSEKSKSLWQDPVYQKRNEEGREGRKPRTKVYTDAVLIDTYKQYLSEKEKSKKHLSWMKYYKSVGIKSPIYFHYKAKSLMERLQNV